jgi:hypothetical protein
MKKISLFAGLIAVLALSACHIHPRHPHDGHFCPPGQAKKGNC